MKKLICAKDVETIKNRGQKVFYIDKDTIITPLAKDAAKNFGIEFSTEVQASKVKSLCSSTEASGDEINSDMIYKVLKVMKEKGLLEEILELFTKKPYISEEGPEGLKVVRGNSIEFDVFDTGNPQDKVFYQELISEDDPLLNAGLLTIDHSNFGQKLVREVVGYVIEGSLNITINGETLTAYPGDVFYMPLDSEVTLGSSKVTKLFYVKS